MNRRIFLRTGVGAVAGLCFTGAVSAQEKSPQEKPESRRFLPLFPLGMVAFPGQDLPLHIFEPRYRQLLGECRD